MRFEENVPKIVRIMDPEIPAIQSHFKGWPPTFEFDLCMTYDLTCTVTTLDIAFKFNGRTMSRLRE